MVKKGIFKINIKQSRKYGRTTLNFADIKNTKTGKIITAWIPSLNKVNEKSLIKTFKW